MTQAKRSTANVERQRAEVVTLPGDALPKVDGGTAEEEETRSFKYDGVEYTIPHASNWDVDVMEGIEDGKMFIAVRSLLGPEQWGVFKANKPTNKQFYELVNAVFGGDDERAES